MQTLFDKFPWLYEAPKGIEYDSKEKSLYMGDYSNRTFVCKTAKKVGKFYYFFWRHLTTLTRWGKPQEVVTLYIVDGQTHELGILNPMYNKTVDIEKELLAASNP